MLRFAVAFLALALVVTSFGQIKADPAPVASAVVQVKLTRGHGSAVHIGGGSFLTAAHVVDGQDGIKILDSMNGEHAATIMWSSSKYDIALLNIATPVGMAKRNVACMDAAPGSAVTAEGYPMTFGNVLVKGYIAGTPREIDHWGMAIVVDLQVAPGMSGGPLSDSNGDIIGIVVGTLNGYAFNFSVPSSTVCKLLGR